jgi:hypothetical protein
MRLHRTASPSRSVRWCASMETEEVPANSPSLAKLMMEMASSVAVFPVSVRVLVSRWFFQLLVLLHDLRDHFARTPPGSQGLLS